MSSVSPAPSVGAYITTQRQIATEAALIGTATTAAGGHGPAVVVDLSAAAKAMMQQAQQGQQIADMLNAVIAAASTPRS
jgi:hypothetical protein